MNGIACPACGREDGWRVINSRPTTGTIRRRRRCECGERMTTHEVSVEELEGLQALRGVVSQLHDVASSALRAHLKQLGG